MVRLIAILLLLMLMPSGVSAQLASAAFGKHRIPSSQAPASYGSYARGCLAGGKLLAETAPGWQAMRLSRNRNWGHPEMIAFIDRLSRKAQAIGWPRLYVGDIGQPRGGPMKSGHRSHQIGLDVDVWLRKPGEKLLSRRDRDRISSHIVVGSDGVTLNRFWTDSHHEVIKAAAQDSAVARIFVNAAIKRHMCRAEQARDGTAAASKWLRKVRPWRGHNAHFHVRLSCPKGSPQCRNQGPVPPGSGCGAELAKWFPRGGRKTREIIFAQQQARPRKTIERSDQEVNPSTDKPAEKKKKKKKRKSRGPLTLGDLPRACLAVLAGENATEAQLAALLPPAEDLSAGPKMAPIPARALVFRDRQVQTHEGLVGLPYYWTPEVNEAALARRDVRLSVSGWLPIGMNFVDRGGGNALLTGVPVDVGTSTFDIVAFDGSDVVARQTVTVPIGDGTVPDTEAGDSQDHKVRDFLTDFTGSECFFANPTATKDKTVKIEAFADDPAPFYIFGSAFKDAVGLDADLDRRLINPEQCEPLAFARAYDAHNAHAIELRDQDGLIPAGQDVEVAVKGDRVRNLSVLMVTPSGVVREVPPGDIADLASTPRVRFKAKEQGPGLVIAIDSASPIDFRRLMGNASDDESVLALLSDEQALQRFDIRTAVGYFIQE